MGQGISEIKQVTSALTETYAMRMRLHEYDKERGQWGLFNGFFKLAKGAENEQGSRIEVKVATWNVWFDPTLCEQRWNGLVDILLAKQVDIIALQEVTEKSNDLMLRRKEIQEEFVTSDFKDVLARSSAYPTWYGTTILVRKSFMVKNGLDNLNCILVRYESRLGRTALIMEFGDVNGVRFRLLTSHFESYPDPPRSRQFATAARLCALPSLQSVSDSFPSHMGTVDDYNRALNTEEGKEFIRNSAPSIICGDTNIDTCSELDILLNVPLNYIDTYGSLHPTPSGTDKYTTSPTFCTTYPNHEGRWTPKRIDYILTRGFKSVEKVELVGNERIGVDARGKDGGLYPSDHLGVVASLVI